MSGLAVVGGQIVGGAILSAIISQLSSDVNQAIDRAKNAGSILIMQSGREVSLAIQSAQNAYASELSKTIEQVDQVTRRTFDQLASITQQIVSGTAQALKDTALRAQQLINSMPFANLEPQVLDVLPHFVTPPTILGNQLLIVTGNFPQIGRPGSSPVLTFKNRSFTPIATTTQQIMFSVPIAAIFSSDIVNASKFTFAQGLLTLPWRQSIVGSLTNPAGLLQNPHPSPSSTPTSIPSSPLLKNIISPASIQNFLRNPPDFYNVLIGSLPATPGKITLNYTTTHVERTTRPFRANQYYFQSSDDAGGNEDHIKVPYTQTPTDGWHVVRNTSFVEIQSTSGEQGRGWSYSFESDDADRVTYTATTIHHGFLGGTSGEIRFRISFDEFQDTPIHQKNKTNIHLRWGDSIALPDDVQIGNFVVHLDAFDGTHYDFTGSDNTQTPYLKLVNEGERIVLQAANASTIDISQTTLHALKRSPLLRSHL